jgi:hypothetical protein
LRWSGTTWWLASVAYGAGRYVAAPSDQFSVLGITCAGDRFVAAAWESGEVWVSEDGRTWQPRATGAADGLAGTVFAGGRFVVVGDGGTILAAEWDEVARRIVARRGAREISLVIGDPTMRLGNRSITLDVPPFVQDGRTLVPLRAVAEGLGAAVEWQGEERRVLIRNGENGQ